MLHQTGQQGKAHCTGAGGGEAQRVENWPGQQLALPVEVCMRTPKTRTMGLPQCGQWTDSSLGVAMGDAGVLMR